jgi:hypothetical protein
MVQQPVLKAQPKVASGLAAAVPAKIKKLGLFASFKDKVPKLRNDVAVRLCPDSQPHQHIVLIHSSVCTGACCICLAARSELNLALRNRSVVV